MCGFYIRPYNIFILNHSEFVCNANYCNNYALRITNYALDIDFPV